MKVWNLIFSYTDYDNPCESYSRVESFSSEEKAEKALEKEYGDTLKGLEADGVLDIVQNDNYGYSAILCTGVVNETDHDFDEISYKFFWIVSKTTIDLHTIEDCIA